MAYYLYDMGIRVFVLGIPKQNSSCGAIHELNFSYYLWFVGIGSNMSTENILAEDEVHLNDKGLSQLTTIINKKYFASSTTNDMNVFILRGLSQLTTIIQKYFAFPATNELRECFHSLSLE